MTTRFPRYQVTSKDGNAQGSNVIDLETGQAIANVRSITLTATAGKLWNCTIELVGVAVDVTVLGDRLTRRFADVPTLPADPEPVRVPVLGAAFGVGRDG